MSVASEPALKSHLCLNWMQMGYCGMWTLVVLACAAAAASTSPRVRPIDRLPRSALFPLEARPATGAAHRRMISSWRAPTLADGSPTVDPVAYGADPTGRTDSTAAFTAAVAALLSRNTSGHHLSDGIVDLGGAVLDLGGGDYLISAPLVIPQFYGNLRIIDGTLRASPTFPNNSYVIQVGATPCSTPSGQGSCNENVGLSGLTVDGSHVAAGCVRIAAVMGATLDSSSAVFGFTQVGVLLEGGHEAMIEETWVAAYFWSDPKKEHNNATGIAVAGNDHFITNTIVFSARVGVHLTGAANLLSGVHTWNCATGNGGVGIQDDSSQNRHEGVYLDFTDLVLTSAQQTSVSSSFFLGNAQLVFAAQSASSAVYGVSLLGNVWYDCTLPSLTVDETNGGWVSVTDLVVEGTAMCGSGQARTGLVRATKTLVVSGSRYAQSPVSTIDFSDVLLFPLIPIASATVQVVTSAQSSVTATLMSVPTNATVAVYTSQAQANAYSLIVSVDQSVSSSWFAAA